MQKYFLSLLLKLSASQRRKRINRLKEHFELGSHVRILDVGGSGDWNWKSFGVDASVTVLNRRVPEGKIGANFIQGDACNMNMFKDGEFDLVFSNSVIEHLPDRAAQQKMAKEIKRVGRAYWVQTPNRHFPLELHLCLPFVQYLPVGWRVLISRYWPFSFEKMRGRSAQEDARAILLSAKEMRKLFDPSVLVRERFVGLTKSLIAVRK